MREKMLFLKSKKSYLSLPTVGKGIVSTFTPGRIFLWKLYYHSRAATNNKLNNYE